MISEHHAIFAVVLSYFLGVVVGYRLPRLNRRKEQP